MGSSQYQILGGRSRLPDWWECSWRRVKCGKSTCLMCASPDQCETIMAERELKRQASPDYDPEWEAEKHELIRQAEQEALAAMERGEAEDDSPDPEEFPIYQAVRNWWDRLRAIEARARDRQAAWLETEAGQDLMWYGTLITGKVYRQLCNRWYADHRRESLLEDGDYPMTQFVLSESIWIIRDSVRKLTVEKDNPQLTRFSEDLIRLTPNILQI